MTHTPATPATPEQLDPSGENYPVEITPDVGSRLETLLAMYPAAKAAADAATNDLKAIADGIKAEAQTLAPTERKLRLGNVLALDYRETWRVDAKRLKAEQPVLYVQYAKKSGAWYLNPVKGQR